MDLNLGPHTEYPDSYSLILTYEHCVCATVTLVAGAESIIGHNVSGVRLSQVHEELSIIPASFPSLSFHPCPWHTQLVMENDRKEKSIQWKEST